jgi:tRNA-2-methylthio-N6-dimethylallyladenosine synthase
MKYYIQTLGCAMNYSDSERVSAILEKIGYQKAGAPEESDLYIFNTCSIRKKGEDRVYGQLRNLSGLKKINPRLLVGITGCMVRNSSSRNSEKEQKDEILKRTDTVDFVFRIKDTQKLGEILEEAEPQLDLPQLEEADLQDYLKIKPQYTSKIQAFVPIQIGCDKYCTYCIVPYSRGREQSRPLKDIVAECRALVEHGCLEITLLGQTVNSYGLSALDKKSGMFEGMEEPFVTLLTEINRLKELGLNRVRFTSSHPRDFTDRLIKAHTELETLCPAIHLPVQAGNDEVLKRMNRQYTVKKYKSIIEKIRRTIPNCAISTDIIVGFCGETEEQFEDTCKLFEEVRWDMAYLARYSPRGGTVSVKIYKDDVTHEEKAKRWHRLNKILEECSTEKNKACEGRVLEVLVEKYHEQTGELEGRSRENKVVQFAGDPSLVRTIVEVKITKGLQWSLKGRAES